MKKVIILGGSGNGMIAASILYKKQDVEIIGFLNDVIPVGDYIGKFTKIKVVGKTEDLPKFLEDPQVSVFIAIIGYLKERYFYNKIQALNIPRSQLMSIIDNTAIIPEGFCKVGEGVLFAPLSQLSTDTTVSDNCQLLPNSFLGHDSYMDEFSHLATNSVIGANCHIGKAVHIGSNATLREKIRVGDFSFVGAGSMVLEDVPENAIVVGNPAKILRYKEQ